jgi:hypothetical protein
LTTSKNRKSARAGTSDAGFFVIWRRNLCAAAISESLERVIRQGLAMKKLLVAVLIVGAFITFDARAQERAGDAALGAVSGAVVLGPVGAVAGALIGFTAGPSIARSWGVRRSSSPRVQRTSQTGAAPEPQTTGAIPLSPPPVIRASPTPVASTKPPPVQSFE